MNLDEKELPEIMFEVTSPIGVKVRTTLSHWIKIRNKHKKIADKLTQIINCIEDPEIIIRSKWDYDAYLSYIKLEKYLLAVVFKRLNGIGYVITSYLADKTKSGELIWQKSK